MSDPSQLRSADLQPRSIPLVACPQCGAENYAFAPRCWICQSEMETEELVAAEKVGQTPAFAQTRATFSANLPVLILLPTLGLVGYGVARVHLGLLLPYLLVVSLPMLGIALMIRGGIRNNRRTASVGGSIAVTISLILMLAVGMAILVVVGIVVFVLLVCTNNIDMIRY
ncbi:hypothetical protein [Blastopirellula retiformator]|uniref:Uncharacterized protein n=1 Tax=Blastopirellula retiformator TaxID=2527970 RepID=A0A5C5UYP3_9BACT|nr:hypothetical protein [Blastopirellula retiformator]TWT31486.1 hypothetical protein Enr8_34070 [Blastopirellula retiformator]